MKSLVIFFLMLCSLTFAQSGKYNIDNVTLTVNRNEVIVDIASYRGNLVVNYYNLNDNQVYVLGEYTNIKGFSEKHTLPSGKYVLEVIKNGVKTKKYFEIKA